MTLRLAWATGCQIVPASQFHSWAKEHPPPQPPTPENEEKGYLETQVCS